MKHYHLPIFKLTLTFCVYIEGIAKNFDRYHRYTMGLDLRNKSKNILFLIHKASIDKHNRKILLTKLRDEAEEMKILLILARELQAFNSFNNFEHASKQTIEICKQSQAWLNSTLKAKK